ncbi:Dyp-type peroxidase [Solilutibacter oculi]|uniref:Dyp-type peroxidase n=1 Tax=Solilutibacter oculi TaxID=2698682 RepID=UPI001582D879|nr:Dyp-type peroxidase [Lysobacter oculi]
MQWGTIVTAAKPQPIVARLTRSAIFLVVTVHPGPEAETAVRGVCADLSSLLRAVGFRDLDSQLSCVLSIGSQAWDRLFPDAPRPRELHDFVPIHGATHSAPATPGDLLFHIRAVQADTCFELATHLMDRLRGQVDVVDEVQGFKFYDDRDLLGFVDGTENPVDDEARESTLVGDEDAAHAGGTYVIVQKYLHDMAAWNALSVEGQEAVIGRHKLNDIEFPDAKKAGNAHNVLTSIEQDGKQLKILRDNMPFGRPGAVGTYFIGYARTPSRTERMLRNMFIGVPEGNHDRILDFNRAVTGGLFFSPTVDFLDAVEA